MRVAYITSGAAGMFCGSCMHDNTLVRALQRKNVDVQLIPTYTPIRTDEEDVSIDRIFFGGINVFLQQKIPFFRHLPSVLDRWFDNPRLLRWVSSQAMNTSPRELGALTVSMLKGQSGYQRKEVNRLCRYLADEVRPQLIVFTNILVAGCIPTLKQTLQVPILVTLQGDDVFLNELPAEYRQRAIDEVQRLVPHIDGYIANSRYYADHMSQLLHLPRDRFHLTALGIDTSGYPDQPAREPGQRPPTVGYLARLSPEKGLHVLVDAFALLRSMPGFEAAHLKIAGWLGEHQQAFAQQQFTRLDALGNDAWEYVGSVDRAGKLELLRHIDVLSVPTTYHEPKGLFVLEALGCGVPFVQPDHGAFPELLEQTGGGLLVRPEDPQHLAERLAELLGDPARRNQLGDQGFQAVHARHSAEAMAQAALDIYRQYAR